MPLDVVKLGASRLSSSGLPIVTATNQVADGDADVEHFGEVDHFNALGITARPYPATADGHAETLIDRGVPGTTGVAIGGRDERCADAYAMLSPGDVAHHATGPKHGAMLLTREDGRVTMLTSEDATVTGRTIFAEVSTDGHRWVGPWGKVTFATDGFHVRHHTGARIDIGGIGGLPSPLDALGAYVTLSAPIIRIDGAAIALGPGAGVPDAVAKSTPLTATLTTISTALAAINVALTNIDAALVPAGAATASVAAATAAIVASVASIATAVATIPSASTTVT